MAERHRPLLGYHQVSDANNVGNLARQHLFLRCGMEIKCERCEKQEPAPGTSYCKHYGMRWGPLTIDLSRSLLCEACIEKLFDKITNALYEDKEE